MLIEIAIGDSYGAGFEYVSDEVIKTHNNGQSYIQHPIHKLRPGQYTDDTQMTIAIYEYLKECKFIPDLDPVIVSNYFYNAFARDKRDGYARGFQSLLEEVSSGKELFEKCNGKSAKNGAAMRACPIGLIEDKDLLKEFAKLQGSITHSDRGLTAAIAVALSVWFLRKNMGDFSDLFEFLNDELEINEDWIFTGKVKHPDDLGMITVKSALTFTMFAYSFNDLLKNCVAATGDVDTNTAIACGIYSVTKQYSEAGGTESIPKHLFHTLETEKYGRDYLIELESNSI